MRQHIFEPCEIVILVAMFECRIFLSHPGPVSTSPCPSYLFPTLLLYSTSFPNFFNNSFQSNVKRWLLLSFCSLLYDLVIPRSLFCKLIYSQRPLLRASLFPEASFASQFIPRGLFCKLVYSPFFLASQLFPEAFFASQFVPRGLFLRASLFPEVFFASQLFPKKTCLQASYSQKPSCMREKCHLGRPQYCISCHFLLSQARQNRLGKGKFKNPFFVEI